MACAILLAISANPSDRCDDRNAVQEKHYEHEYNRHRRDLEPMERLTDSWTLRRKVLDAEKYFSSGGSPCFIGGDGPNQGEFDRTPHAPVVPALYSLQPNRRCFRPDHIAIALGRSACIRPWVES
jgi:hypothetical protein